MKELKELIILSGDNSGRKSVNVHKKGTKLKVLGTGGIYTTYEDAITLFGIPHIKGDIKIFNSVSHRVKNSFLKKTHAQTSKEIKSSKWELMNCAIHGYQTDIIIYHLRNENGDNILIDSTFCMI